MRKLVAIIWICCAFLCGTLVGSRAELLCDFYEVSHAPGDSGPVCIHCNNSGVAVRKGNDATQPFNFRCPHCIGQAWNRMDRSRKNWSRDP